MTEPLEALRPRTTNFSALPVRTTRHRTIPVFVAFLAGICLSFLAYQQARSREYSQLQKEFVLDSKNRIASIRREVDSNLAALKSVAAYSEIAAPLTAANFESFAERVRGVYPTILALEWLPRVTQAQRKSFEERASAQQKYPVQITEGRRPAEPYPAGIRPEYFPVEYMTPHSSRGVIGFDVAFEPNVRFALGRARDSGNAFETGRFSLIEKAGDGYGVPIYSAVYKGGSQDLTVEQRRERLAGYVMEVVQISTVLDRAIRVFGPERLDFSFYDRSAAAGKRLLYVHRSTLETRARTPLSEAADLTQGDFRYISQFEIASRQWAVVCTATPGYLDAARSGQPLGILLAGFAGTIAIVAYFLLNAAYGLRADRLVAQLYFINGHLNDEVQERKKAEREVTRLNSNLENRVHERTEQLRVANVHLIAAQGEADRVHQEELRHLRSKQQAEEALRESEQRYALAALGSKDGLWDWNLTTNHVYYSPRWKNMLGFSEHQIGSSPEEWLTRVHPADVARVKAELEAHRVGITPHFQSEHRVRHSDGGYCWMLVRGVAVFGSVGTPARMAGSQTDITDGKVADPLTGLRTRLSLLDKLEMAIGRMREHPDVLFAVLFLDLDRFKVVNDSLGHLAGDRLLAGIAQRLQSCVGLSELEDSQVTIARIGGDEFAILLERISSPAPAQAFAETINREMKSAFDLDGHQVFASSSIGLAMGSDATTAEDILRDADTAMYQAKAHGRERYEVFNPAMRTQAIERLELETELRQAIKTNALEIYYQPKISLTTGKISDFEALVRWQHPTRGMIKPQDFVPLAEETGLIIPLGTWVLQTACRQMAQWHSDYPASAQIGLSVNLSTRQFAEKDLVENIAGVLANSGLPAHCLSLELTESVLMRNPDEAIAILNALRSMHIGLKIDDFGTGFSSLGYLHRLPFNELKIDRSFVEGLGKQRESQQIVRTIILLAQSLRMSVVAEGVESTAQLGQLASLGCHFVQGDLLSPPLQIRDAVRFLARNLLFIPAALPGLSQNELVAIYAEELTPDLFNGDSLAD